MGFRLYCLVLASCRGVCYGVSGFWILVFVGGFGWLCVLISLLSVAMLVLVWCFCLWCLFNCLWWLRMFGDLRYGDLVCLVVLI